VNLKNEFISCEWKEKVVICCEGLDPLREPLRRVDLFFLEERTRICESPLGREFLLHKASVVRSA
jgi:hypothetical protein